MSTGSRKASRHIFRIEKFEERILFNVAPVDPTPGSGIEESPLIPNAAISSAMEIGGIGGFIGDDNDPASLHAFVGAHGMQVDMGMVPADPNDAHIHLGSDVIYNFAQNPDNLAVQSGSWFDANTWSTGHVPTAGEVVQITDGNVVIYDGISDVAIKAIGVNPGGTLQFATDTDTRLKVGTLLVFAEGHLQIGTEANPIETGVMAELVIADQPLDLDLDPNQFGTGLIGLGKIDIVGEAKNLTWVRLAAEAHTGDTFLESETAVIGWHAGDTLILPDTRQVPPKLVKDVAKGLPGVMDPEWEEITIDRIEGNRIYLTSPLSFDHLGAHNADGALEILPHVGLLNRNVVIRSENPDGTRGHVLFAQRAEVNVQYARFSELGRTDAFLGLDSTKFDAEGRVTHIGTNQIARYAFHFHHVAGPVNPTNTGYQFMAIGNTIDAARKWSFVVHGTSFGLIKDNVAYDGQGAGFVTEDGTEIGNDFIGNFAMKIQGTGVKEPDGIFRDTTRNDYGRGGSGFWFRRAGNNVDGNVAVNTTFGGFVVNGYKLPELTVPAFRGAMPRMPGQGITQRVTLTPDSWQDNEIYGRTPRGWWIALPNTTDIIQQSPEMFEIANTSIWNTHKAGIEMHHVNGVTFSDLTIIGDTSVFEQYDAIRGPVGIDFRDYEADNVVIERAHIEGMKVGIYPPEQDAGGEDGGNPTVIKDSYLRNYLNIVVRSSKFVPYQRDPHRGKGLEIRNVVFDSLNIDPLPDIAEQYNIYMEYVEGGVRTIMGLDRVKVFDYNGTPGDNFQIYYNEQQADHVPAETGAFKRFFGSPVAGLTNQELWDQFGIAVAGALAPCVDGACSNAQNRGEIFGLAFPIAGTAIIGPTTTNIGEVVTFTLTDISDPTSVAEYTFDVDWDANGTVDETILGPLGTQVTHIFNEPGPKTIRVVFSDSAGQSLLATHAINVVGTFPELAVNGPVNGLIGQQQLFRVIEADPSGQDVSEYTFDIDWDADGAIDETVGGPLGTQISHTFQTLGVHNVVIVVRNATGESVSIGRSINITSDVPSLAIAGPSQGLTGGTLIFALDAVDASRQGEGMFTFQIDWDGDGVSDETLAGASGTQIQHIYQTAGARVMQVTAIDSLGGSQGLTKSVNVLPAQLVELDIIGPAQVIAGQANGFTIDLRTLTGDANRDGVVDIGDFTIWSDMILQPSDTPDWYRADFNANGLVDIGDFTSWLDNFGATGTESAEFSAINRGDGLTFTIDWNGDGVANETVQGTLGTQIDHVFDTAGVFDLSITAMNSLGQTRQVTRAIQIVAAIPELAVQGPTEGLNGVAQTFSLTTLENAAPQSGNYTFQIDWNGDGTLEETVEGPLGTPITHVFASTGLNQVKFTVSDAFGQSRELTRSIQIFAQLPDLTIVGSAEGFVGETQAFLVASVNPSDATNDLLTYDIDWDGDGAVDQSFQGSLPTSAAHVFDTDGVYNVDISVTGPLGQSQTLTHTIQINPVDIAVLALAGPSEGLRGETQVFTLGEAGPAVNLMFRIDWNNDGVVDQVVSGAPGMQVEHSFSDVGTNAIGVAAVDNTGNVVSEAVHEINVVAFLLRDNGGGQTNLVYAGTDGDDTLAFWDTGAPAGPIVIGTDFDGERFTHFELVEGVTGDVVVRGRGGNDFISAEGLSVTATQIYGDGGNDELIGGGSTNQIFGGDGEDLLVANGTFNLMDGGAGGDTLRGGNGTDVLFGGAGNDLISGGAGNDGLFGNEGNDTLMGGFGRDLLFGGSGADFLDGGSGEDLLVADLVSFEDDFDALTAVFDEWTSPRYHATRIANLSGIGTGQRINRDVFLQGGTTVLDDGAGDILRGGADADWLFFTAGQDQWEDPEATDIFMNLN